MVTDVDRFQADTLERDALEVLSLTRFLKNSLAPVNRIPPDVLSLIPYYCAKDYADRSLITLTHVCRGWRETFTARSSLWTRLDFLNIDKTRTYIQRSKSAPLHVYLQGLGRSASTDSGLYLVVPHVCRLQSLVIHSKTLPDIPTYFRHQAPLLEKLEILTASPDAPILDSTMFDGDLSSLRELSLRGVITYLPWKNLTHLRNFYLCCPPGHKVTVTRLLDVFESAPFLHRVEVENVIPNSSDVPRERIVPLRHLNSLAIDAFPTILLNHLHIPIGASLVLGDRFRGEESPLLDYLPEKSPNLKNLSHINMVNFRFDFDSKYIQLSGPSGCLRLAAYWDNWEFAVDHRIFCSISPPILFTIQRLAVSKYLHPVRIGVEEYPIFQTLSAMNNLQTLILSECDNLPFILTLIPEDNSPAPAPCPKLGELVLYSPSLHNRKHTKDLINMAKSRDSRGAKLSSITIVDLDTFAPKEEASKLEEHIGHVEYRTEIRPPLWDSVPD